MKLQGIKYSFWDVRLLYFKKISTFWPQNLYLWCLEWLHFLHLNRNEHITNPKRACFGVFKEYCWDAATTQQYSYDPKGPHALCDVDGNSLKLSDVEDGMSVKIRAKHLSIGWPRRNSYIGYDYLYTAYGLYGKYLAINNILFWIWYVHLLIHTETNFVGQDMHTTTDFN